MTRSCRQWPKSAAPPPLVDVQEVTEAHRLVIRQRPSAGLGRWFARFRECPLSRQQWNPRRYVRPVANSHGEYYGWSPRRKKPDANQLHLRPPFHSRFRARRSLLSRRVRPRRPIS